jgi:hypothetical protein
MPDKLGMLKHGGPQYQPLKTFIARNVQPQQVSTIQLSGGKTQPYYYALASTSTVPFASVQGAGGIQKDFSWGEVIEIPPGLTVNVTNSSRHAGDIIIQSGQDRSNTPARISFPISFELLTDAITYGQRGFIDTRRARRCYWVFNPFNVPEAFSFDISILGYYAQHTANPEGNNIFDSASWISTVNGIVPGQVVSMAPICLSADYQTYVVRNMLPMVMADYERIFFIWDAPSPPEFNFAVLEYE